MISRIEFLFPAQAPNLASPELLKMIREVGEQNRWTEWSFFGVGLFVLVPVVVRRNFVPNRIRELALAAVTCYETLRGRF